MIGCLLALTGWSMIGVAQPEAAQAAAMTQKLGSPSPAGTVTAARYDGYAGARFGMTEQAFAKAWRGSLQHQTQVTPGCYYIYPKWAEHDNRINLAFMFVDGHFVRYDVGEKAMIAPGGGRIGMSLTQIHDLYGAGVVEGPRDYFNSGKPDDAKARSLHVHAPGSTAMLQFDTDVNGHVDNWRIGMPPAVDFMEGCL